jgi:hypothetical protein
MSDHTPLAVWISLAMVACVPDFETDLSALRAPRILALSASPAEAREGQAVTLRALVAVPEGANVPNVDFRLCLARKPLTELGPVNPECLSGDDTEPEPEAQGGGGAPAEALPSTQPLGRGLEVTATLPRDACKLFGPLRPAPKEGEPSGRPVDPDVTGGFYQPFVARLGQALSIGGVRIDCDLATASRDNSGRYREQYRPNENPILTRIELGDEPLALDAPRERREVRAGTEIELVAWWDECPTTSSCGDGFCTANEDRVSCAEDCTEPRGCGGSERYVWYDADKRSVEPRREAITVAWYASSGRFLEEQTGLSEAEADSGRQTANRWRVGGEAGSATLWLVVRDSRGGQTWRSLYFDIVP